MLKDFDLQGRVAVVTGATGLLGREHCKALAEAGAHVVVADLDGDACTQFAQSLPVESIGVNLDVTRKPSVEEALSLILKKWGRIDVLVNNAAVNDKVEGHQQFLERSSFEQFPVEQWEKSLSVNVTGVFLCCQVFGAEMARKGRGSIINIGSTYGVVAPDQSLYLDREGRREFFKSPVYPATKGAVISLTRFLSAYWGSVGVRVNTLSPGGVENGQPEHFIDAYSKKTPLGRMAGPREFRGALVYLASDASSYVSGANLLVDGGWTAW